MRTLQTLVYAAAVAVFVAASAGAVEYKVFESKKYGYKMKIPAQFELQGQEDKTSTFSYQPGAKSSGGSAASETTKKKTRIGISLGPIQLGKEESKESSTEGKTSSGGLESALTIYINWTWMPDVTSGTSYSINKKDTEQNIASPDPDYKDLEVFGKKKGYAYEGNVYRFKEVDKKDPTAIHRWHVKAFGNKSHYTLGFTGTFGQFKEWGPIYDEVIKSFELIPMEKQP